MTVQEAKYLSKKIMESGEVPLLVGHFGVGKTDIAREIAEESGRELIILVLSQMEPGDLIGLPSRSEGKTIFLAPDWWPENDNCIIFLDEINRSHRSIRNAIMQLLIDRRIHNHVLPDGVWIIASMNPPDEDYDQVDLITDPAFLSRFFILEISPHVDEWLKWADKYDVPEEIKEFIKGNPEFLATSSPVSLKANIKPSPRSWFKLGKVLKNMSDEEKEKYAYFIASGILGPEVAKTFYDNTFSSVPTAREILLAGKIPSNNNKIHITNSMIIRIVDFFSSIDESTGKEMFAQVDTIAHNLLKLSRQVPKDSFFSLVRLLNELSNEPGIKGELCDKLLEKISYDA
ncbi:MoxR family ATPase [Thermosipho ferrireducens]|uniref:MoxR family ATPase n=1 Tax=Thermosipho ferrireducens TaxID=2571116 RepID=A0ABX7S842_9BACT|nr:MoxR family ATPase [Thermosipho ferrireducens]QTA38758.1 MoxR family ATPase [Thermosipho ferrireducens]